MSDKDETKASFASKPAKDVYDFARQRYEFVQDTFTGDPYAYDKETGSAIILAKDGRFVEDLAGQIFDELKQIPRGASINDALRIMVREARKSQRPVHIRLAESESGTWIDLADKDGNMVHITPEGWEVTKYTGFSPLFRRSSSMLPMAMPERMSDNEQADALTHFLRLTNVTKPSRPLLLAWLLMTLTTETRSIPLLLLQAEQGSGKSTLMKMILDLVDPGVATGGPLPSEGDKDRKMAVLAMNSRVLRFDNLSTLKPDIQDLLCNVVTGGTVQVRKNYTNDELCNFQLQRPAIMTAINLGSNKPDFTQRVVRIEMNRIAPEQRLTEQRIHEEWEELKPRLLGTLLSMAVSIMRVSQRLKTKTNERMADYARILAALDDIMPTLNAVETYRTQQTMMAAESICEEPLYIAMSQVIGFDGAGWTGTSAALLEKLRDRMQTVDSYMAPPSTPTAVARTLDRIAPALREEGWSITSKTVHKQKQWNIRKAQK